MKYRENIEQTKEYKQNYLDGLNSIIEKRQESAKAERREYVKDIFTNPKKYRQEFKEILGWPLVNNNNIKGIVEPETEKLAEEEGYSIYRMRFEILPGLKITGLFFKHNGDEKRPLVIVQHGGGGTPERISGVYGKTWNYNDMLHRVIKHGVNAFAPQLFLWNEEEHGIKRDRKEIDARLKRVGGSITAVEIYGIMRIIDYFETQSYVANFGMVGLSYGGFYTLFTTALETRIKSAISCAFFNTRDAYPWSDWTWWRAAYKFDDAEIACLCYPRHIVLEIGTEDELFECKNGIESFETVKELSREVGEEWVTLKVFEGTHEFCKDDAPIEKLVEDLI